MKTKEQTNNALIELTRLSLANATQEICNLAAQLIERSQANTLLALNDDHLAATQSNSTEQPNNTVSAPSPLSSAMFSAVVESLVARDKPNKETPPVPTPSMEEKLRIEDALRNPSSK